MRAVDTNLLVRLLLRDDATQVAAAEAFIANGAWISHVVLAETAWVLRRRLDHAAILRAVEMLLNHQHFTIQEPDVVAEALDHYRRRPSLGFSDCLILATARNAGHLPLGTFDKALATLDGAVRL
jgi:predicted nucleic-acid-binding protein